MLCPVIEPHEMSPLLGPQPLDVAEEAAVEEEPAAAVDAGRAASDSDSDYSS